MKLSKKAEYALRALVVLAGRPSSQSIQIQELATIGSIPVKFLEQILLVLKRSSLLVSKRGVGGGYQLNRPANQIFLAEVIEIMDGPLLQSCCEPPDSSAPGFRGLHQSMQELNSLIITTLRSQSIADILAREEPDSVLALNI
ncbi:MAG: Rrf2 family transcriptional regulator [Verrucomicrobiota bacterium]